MTTERDLIQRLANALHDAAEDVGCWGSYASGYFQEKHDLPGNIAKIHAQAEEARAYLSQPEPEGVEDRIFKLEADLERERLRLAACGVVAMADTPESAAKARDMSPEYHSASLADVIHQIDALMELRAAIKPVPVSERLPGEGDCDPSFQCWWFTPSEEKWILWPIKWAGPECSHWLPHHALPVPTFTEAP